MKRRQELETSLAVVEIPPLYLIGKIKGSFYKVFIENQSCELEGKESPFDSSWLTRQDQ